MTPQEYVARLVELVGAGRDEEALEFSSQHCVAMTPLLTLDEIDLVSGLMESAELVASTQAHFQAEQTGPSSGNPAA